MIWCLCLVNKGAVAVMKLVILHQTENVWVLEFLDHLGHIYGFASLLFVQSGYVDASNQL